mmetsp:Transcript_15641/g.44651  ORF Transcript_15641/g.44651 Transcript_15641/m.44651 type:complete len:213 (-) Transcript_15641:329-967(-)
MRAQAGVDLRRSVRRHPRVWPCRRRQHAPRNWRWPRHLGIRRRTQPRLERTRRERRQKTRRARPCQRARQSRSRKRAEATQPRSCMLRKVAPGWPWWTSMTRRMHHNSIELPIARRVHQQQVQGRYETENRLTTLQERPSCGGSTGAWRPRWPRRPCRPGPRWPRPGRQGRPGRTATSSGPRWPPPRRWRPCRRPRPLPRAPRSRRPSWSAR